MIPKMKYHNTIQPYLQVWGVAYNDNGSKLVSVSDDKNIIVYDCPI